MNRICLLEPQTPYEKLPLTYGRYSTNVVPDRTGRGMAARRGGGVDTEDSQSR